MATTLQVLLVLTCAGLLGVCQGYNVKSVKDNTNQLHLDLGLTDGEGPALFGADIPNLSVQVTYETFDRLHVKITDSAKPRWEVPDSILPVPKNILGQDATSNSALEFVYTESPFSFQVKRRDDGEVIYDSKGTPFVFEDQYLQFGTSLPEEPVLYGLGEHVRKLKLDVNRNYTMWTLDSATPPDLNVYGSHPFYLEMRNGKAHGVFLKNSNGMDVEIQPGILTFRVIGGIIDLYFFAGSAPSQVVQQYTEVIGKPHLPPYWSLGWHQCRYGFKNLEEVKGVVAKYEEYNLPLDTIWFDIDYMEAWQDFTWNKTAFPQDQVKEFVDDLHKKGMRAVVIVDPAIHADPALPSFAEGVKRNVFIKTADGKPFVGKVWPGLAAFPDFLNPETTSYWTEHISEFLDGVSIDGLWIDMNEASNFCNGACDAKNSKTMESSSGFNAKNPPYAIDNNGEHQPLNFKAIDTDAVHFGGVLEYDVHNLYGFTEAIATRKALLSYRPDTRPFILTRSTFPGSGVHAAHWLGDNHANWDSMRFSISGALSFNMFGIPFVGADVCGFLEESTEELCIRWHALGAFYPFARHHKDIHFADSYPYLWESVRSVAAKALSARYSLLPYYYTQFYKAHLLGTTVMRPLFFEFTSEVDTLDIDTQFLIGRGIMVAPVVDEGARSLKAYFPSSVWYDFWTLKKVPYSGEWVTLDAPLDSIFVYIRGGLILALQEPGRTTVETRKNPLHLVVALDENGKGEGFLHLDDGESENSDSTYTDIMFVASDSSLQTLLTSAGFSEASDTKVHKISVLGVSSKPKSVRISGVELLNFGYDEGSSILTLENLQLAVDSQFTVTWN